MHYLPPVCRYRRKHRLRLHYHQPAPGVFGVGLGEGAYQLEVRELLANLLLRGKV